MTRLESNRVILEKLKGFIESNPDIRFIQALWVLGIINSKSIYNKGYHEQLIEDRFYEEPSETLKRIGYEEDN